MYDGQYDLRLPCPRQFYRPPDRFPHTDWVLVAEVPKAPKDGDGWDVRVYESRAPARFYKIEGVASPNSIGRERRGFTISTGSSMHELTARLVKEITEGMLSVGEEA